MRAVVWRHNLAGVWIGWLTASEVPGHVRMQGRRIRAWSGAPLRIDCSSLARLGVGPGDTLTEWTETDIALEGSVEIHDTPEELVRAAQERP